MHPLINRLPDSKSRGNTVTVEHALENSNEHRMMEHRSDLMRDLLSSEEKNRSLRRDLKKLSGVIHEHREFISIKRDTLNASRDARAGIIEKLRAMKESSRQISQNFNGRSFADGAMFEDRLKKTEWKLQTERLSRTEEKKLVQYAKECELNLVQWRKDFTSNEELTKLGNEAETLKMKLDEIRGKYEATIKEIGLHRTELDEKFETRAKLIHELESVTEISSKQEKELETLSIQVAGMMEKKTLDHKRLAVLRDEEYRAENSRVIKKELEMIEELRVQAQGKRERGEKLSFDEFKVLFSSD